MGRLSAAAPRFATCFSQSRRRLLAAALPAMMARPSKAAVPLHVACLSSQPAESTSLDAFRKALLRLDAGLAARVRYSAQFAGFDRALLHRRARMLNAGRPGLILCFDFDAAAAAVATRDGAEVPVVFRAHDDPLARGLIESYARPGRNITGVTTYRCIDAKLVELLCDALPTARRLGFIRDPGYPDGGCNASARRFARARGVVLDDLAVSSPAELGALLRKLSTMRHDGLVFSATAVTWRQRKQIIARLDELSIPAIYEGKVFVDDGGLMQFSALHDDAFAQMARAVVYVARTGRAGDFPVSQPVHFELTINLGAAHARAYRLSPDILRRADRIIE